jgi:hypothetical protein
MTDITTPNQQLLRIAQGNGPSAEFAAIKLAQHRALRLAQREATARQRDRVMALRRQRLERCL